MPSISLCMIVKNEEEVLDRCLASVRHIVDEIVVVDTGSTDATIDIARAHGCRIIHEQWCDDFAAARNTSFAHATSDYILWLDADDIVLPDQAQRIAELKPALDRDVYYLRYDYAQDENGASLCTLWRERIVRRAAGLQWHYPIHECLLVGQEHSSSQEDITITHRRTASGFAADTSRNRRILERALTTEQYRHDPRIHYYLAKEYQQEGLLQQAADLFRTYLSLPGGWREDRVNALHRLAQTLCTIAETHEQPQTLRREARELAYEALAMDRNRAEPYFVLGSLAFTEGDYEEAAFHYRRCLRPLPGVLSPVEPFFYEFGPLVQLCVCYHRLGDHSTANSYNERALLVQPDNAVLHNNRALLREALRSSTPPATRIALGMAPVAGYTHHTTGTIAAPEYALPFADNTVESLHADCVLEQYSSNEWHRVLSEWHRVLKPGSELIASSTDFEVSIQHYVQLPPEQRTEAAQQLYCTNGTARRSALSAEAFRREVEKAGFIIDLAGTATDSTHVWIRATKPVHHRRIGWLGAGIDLSTPQFRLRMYHIDRWLRSRGYCSAVISPTELPSVETVIFGRSFTEEDYALMQRAHADGKYTVLDICEDLFDLPFPLYRPMIEAADYVVCCSHALEAKVREFNRNTTTIQDAVEADFDLNCAYEHRSSLVVGWIGMGGGSYMAEALRPLIQNMGHRLVTIHEHDNADIRWNIETWQQELIQCDIAILPADYYRQPSKSNNRLTTLMALGLPVVAAPLDAYKRIVEHGTNALLAATQEEWQLCLSLLQDTATRIRIGRAGKETARRDFHLDSIAAVWCNILFRDEPAATAPTTPVVDIPVADIIVPTRNNPEYLSACVQSIGACTPQPHRIIVVNNGDPDNLPALPHGTLVVHSSQPLTFAAAVNLGIQHSTAPYICIANDDIIVTNNWLAPLLEQVQNGAGLCNPLSNCDMGWLHHYALDIQGLPLLPGGNALQDGNIVLRSNDSHAVPAHHIYGYNPSKTRIYDREWVAFFCTLVDRRVLDTVGLLDEEFMTGCEDLDYCLRAAALGFCSRVDERSFVLHFGGVSRQRSEAERPDQYHHEDRSNHARITLKYSRPVLALHTGPAFEPWTAAAINSGGIGGSETAAAYIAEAFVQCGYRVVLFCPCAGMEGVYNGVEYTDSSRFESIASTTVFDVFIGSRYTTIFNTTIRARRRYLWVHDIRAMGNDSRNLGALADYLDAIVCVSPWHRSFFAEYYGIPASRIAVIGNALDPSRFQRTVERQRHRFIYASSPDRGLDTLLYLFPFIREHIPDAELHIFYGFDNWNKALSLAHDADAVHNRDTILRAMQQPGVYYHGRIGQHQLAEEFLRSHVWFYPTRFWETYCITALEAQMAGTLCVCSDVAALSTTVGSRGVLLPGDAYTVEYRHEALSQLYSLLHDTERCKQLSKAGREWAQIQTWQQRATEWMELFNSTKYTSADINSCAVNDSKKHLYSEK